MSNRTARNRRGRTRAVTSGDCTGRPAAAEEGRSGIHGRTACNAPRTKSGAAARNRPRGSRVSPGVVSQLQQSIARRPLVDLAVRALVIALLALAILVGLPAIAAAAA